MIVYRTARERVAPAARLRALADALGASCPGHPSHDRLVEHLIEFGALEAGVLDVLHPEVDDLDSVDAACGSVALALGRAVDRSWRGDAPGTAAALCEARAALGALAACRLPDTIVCSVAEGFAYYALYPENYAEAARRLLAELRPRGAVCLGLRSIGTTLSAVVAAALGEAGLPVERHTLRPHGHPFDRRPRIGPALAARLRALAVEGPSLVLLVDEGPGLSGSSLAGSAEALAELGVSDERIVLMPSWRSDGTGLLSELARRRWPRHRQYVVTLDELRREHGPRLHPELGGDVEDLSAGAWRVRLPGTRRLATQPQHERVKYLVSGNHPRLLRFAGLGRTGRAAAARAALLADAGFAPAPLGLARGFLAQPLVAGTPLSGPDRTPALLDRMADYLAFLRAECPGTRSVEADELCDMIRRNVAEGLGPRWAERLERNGALGGPALCPATAIDGRMQPHEWLRTPTGYLKVDALDHGDDHFLPGHQDVAWDLAGAMVEFDLDVDERSRLVARYAARSGDREVAARLPFHRLAYLAFRLGYVRLAERAVDAVEAARFAALGRRYARALRAEIDAPRPLLHA